MVQANTTTLAVFLTNDGTFRYAAPTALPAPMPAEMKTSKFNFAGGGDDKAVVMVMCNRQEWLVDLVREPGMLLPLRPDIHPQAPHPNLLSGHPSGLGLFHTSLVSIAWHLSQRIHRGGCMVSVT